MNLVHNLGLTTGRAFPSPDAFLLILKLSYLTGKEKMNLSDFLNFTNQPKVKPFLPTCIVHFLQALLFAKEKKREKKAEGLCP